MQPHPMSRVAQGEAVEAPEQKYTTWHNPLPYEQKVVVHNADGRMVKFTVPSGGEKQIPSEYDFAIQKVQCADPQCRAKGGLCTKGHPGTVLGGLAPQLRRKDVAMSLAKGLDTQAEARERAEADLLAAATRANAAQTATILAAARAEALETKPAADAEDAPAEPPKAAKGGDERPKKLPPSLA